MLLDKTKTNLENILLTCRQNIGNTEYRENLRGKKQN